MSWGVRGRVFLCVCSFLYLSESARSMFFSSKNSVLGSLPPHYYEYHDFERQLPQHDHSLPAPEGKHAKFVFMKNHVVGML